MCAVTFTSHSADELKHRTLLSCGQDNARRMAVGTFHSLCLNQLKRNLRKVPRLLNEGERLAVLRRCWKQHYPKASFEDVQRCVDSSKSRLTKLDLADAKMQAVIDEYSNVLAAENAMDFSDLLLKAVLMMQSGEIPPLPIQWLLVDEAQDMDEVQMEWILLHGRSGVHVTLVGDDDQSLYAFRNALGYQGIQEVGFALAATEITLPVNYRCVPTILNPAARLIGHNKNRAHKQITAHRQDDGLLQKVRCADRWDELDQLLKAVQEHDRGKGWAVLTRTGTLLDEVELTLLANEIEFARIGGKSVWDGMIGSTLLGLLRTITDGSWTGIANALSFAGVSPTHLNIKAHSAGDVFDRLTAALSPLPDGDMAKKTMLRLWSGMAAWAGLRDKGRTNLIIHGVVGFLADYCKTNQLDLLRRLEGSLTRLNGTLQQRIQYVSRSASSKEIDDSIVQLLTLHSSKGLEFNNVWIFACEEGNLPHTDASEEDERRLFYVGMTRARNRLFISSAIEEGLESRFITEAGL